MRDLDIWNCILEQPDTDILALVIVTQSAGSSPGKQGFKMVINQDGRLAGTIGGGIMEKRVIDDVVAALGQKNRLQRLDHRTGSEHASGLNCSGWQEIVICNISLKDRDIFSKIVASYPAESTPTLYVTTETIGLNQSIVGDLLYREVVAQPDRAYIFGGGHVGTAIANQLVLLDFDVTVFDPRPDMISFHPEPLSYQFKTGSIKELQQKIMEGAHTYLIITSNSIQNDIEALRFCLEKQVHYIGFMGSKTKISMAKQQLNSDLKQVHAPIGINIPNRTPAEIAVSVAAELISIRNR